MQRDEGRLSRKGIFSFKYLKRNKFSIPGGYSSRTREPKFNTLRSLNFLHISMQSTMAERSLSEVKFSKE